MQKGEDEGTGRPGQVVSVSQLPFKRRKAWKSLWRLEDGRAHLSGLEGAKCHESASLLGWDLTQSM